MGTLVHIKSLHSIQFSYELLNISIKHRLYLIHMISLSLRRNHFGYACILLPSRGIVVEPNLSVLAADCLLFLTFRI